MDKKHGKGMYSWADGRRYDGMWLNGKQHGEGKYVLADGTVKMGIWKNGKRVRWLEEGGDSAEKQPEKEEVVQADNADKDETANRESNG